MSQIDRIEAINELFNIIWLESYYQTKKELLYTLKCIKKLFPSELKDFKQTNRLVTKMNVEDFQKSIKLFLKKYDAQIYGLKKQDNYTLLTGDVYDKISQAMGKLNGDPDFTTLRLFIDGCTNEVFSELVLNNLDLVIDDRMDINDIKYSFERDYIYSYTFNESGYRNKRRYPNLLSEKPARLIIEEEYDNDGWTW